MADWADTSPQLSTAYALVLTNLRDRDKDAATMFYTDPTNPVQNMIRFNRSTNVLQEYLTATWTNKVLAIAGGGTGGATAAAARAALGIATMGAQESNAVAITGGSITGLTALGVTGTVDFAGGIEAGSGNVGIVDATGKIPALTATYFASLSAAALTSLPVNQFGASIVPAANLGTGTPSAANFLRGDGTWVAVPSGMTSGMIAIFDAACPAGWTRVTAWDGLFLRGDDHYGGTGGSTTHSHTIDSVGGHTHTGTTDSTNTAHTHTFTTNEDSAGAAVVNGPGIYAAVMDHHHTGTTASSGSNHTHTFTTASGGGHTHTESAVDGRPPYINVIFCKKD